MNKEQQNVFLVLAGVLALRLGLTNLHVRYVKPAVGPLLTISGAVLVAVAVLSLAGELRARRGRGAALEAAPHGLEVDAAASAGDDADRDGARGGGTAGHDHGTVSRVAWLLALPVLAVFVIAPSALGADAASRDSGVQVAQQDLFGPLPPPSGGAVPLTLSEFVTRALYDDHRSLAGVPVALTGFVTPAPGTGGYYLTRFVLSCCAADARAVKVLVRADDGSPPPAANQWEVVVGIWRPVPLPPGAVARTPPELAASAVTPVAAPAKPYE